MQKLFGTTAKGIFLSAQFVAHAGGQFFSVAFGHFTPAFVKGFSDFPSENGWCDKLALGHQVEVNVGA